MQIELDGSGPVDMTEPPSFTLSQSGTFVKEDFVINRQGIAAVNGTEVTAPHAPHTSQALHTRTPHTPRAMRQAALQALHPSTDPHARRAGGAVIAPGLERPRCALHFT